MLNAHDIAKRIATEMKSRDDIANAQVVDEKDGRIKVMVKTQGGHWFDVEVMGPTTYETEEK